MNRQKVIKGSLLATGAAVIAAFAAGAMSPNMAVASYDHFECIRDCQETANDCNLNCWGDPYCVQGCQGTSAACELGCDQVFSC